MVATKECEPKEQAVAPCICQHLWMLHGHRYDLSEFVSRHPGGASFLLAVKGNDITELFESVHQLSSRDFDAILSKYVAECPAHPTCLPELFAWDRKNAHFFHRLRDEVKLYFSERKLSYKAPVSYWIAVVALLLCIIASCLLWIQNSNSVFAFVSGVLSMLFNFMVMHAASHGALSDQSWVNWSLYAFWSDWMAWPHIIWFQHHIYGHHSYTGIYGKDPDLRNMNPFARKHYSQKQTKLGEQQGWLGVLVMTIFPNQHLGQMISYLVASFRRKLFGMPISLTNRTLGDTIMYFTVSLGMVTALFFVPILKNGFWTHLASVFAYLAGCGLIYWALVFPNHDTEELVVNCGKATNDWAKSQILHSSNFWVPEFVAQLMGGMNYQIEHHLFPAVHPAHYKNLSVIVKRICAEFDLPYTCHPTWLSALSSHLRFLRLLARPKSQ